MKKDVLGNRMKEYYEDRSRYYLSRRIPVIMRLDGKALHTFTRYMKKPFSIELKTAMTDTAMRLVHEIQGAKLAYTQSDEISILITDYDNLETEAWFDYNIQKMVSVAASIASVAFRKSMMVYDPEVAEAYFDARVFSVPKEDVTNYFLWNFKDWERKSIQILTQSPYSRKELHGRHEMCFQKGHNWNDLADMWKNGTFIHRGIGEWRFDSGMKLPDDRLFIENIVYNRVP